MLVPDLPMHEGLLSRSRLRSSAVALEPTRIWEMVWLVAMGVAAAWTANFWDWSLQILLH